jgi:hypothetical protein
LADKSLQGHTVQVCPEIYPRLWSGAVSERFIEITGYLAYMGDVPIIYASRDIYLYSAGKGGVLLDINPSERGRFVGLVKGEAAITVAGKYLPGPDSKYSSIGRLEVMGRHYWQQEMVGQKPSLPAD